jgi:hypothetical protein
MNCSTHKAIPLTFSSEEIVCLQNGHKTQFRRALKGRTAFLKSPTTSETSGHAIPVLKCPYGQPGTESGSEKQQEWSGSRYRSPR